MEELMELMAFYTTYSAMLSLVSVAFYVLQSLGMYTIAQRRGIANAWLAWVPVGNVWILGAIADDYQLKANGQIKNRRKLLLGVNIGVVAIAPLAMILLAMSAIDPDAIFAVLGILILFMLALMVVAVVAAIFTYICLYDLYASCDPSNKTLFLILSIFFGNVSAILVFIVRNKDLGMTPALAPNYYQQPQYQQPPYQAPQYQQPPYQAPQYQQPQYQAPQYQQPQYQAPQYQQPQYQAPQYQQPQQQAPQYQPPQQPPVNEQ